MREAAWWLGVALVFAADRLSKLWVLAHIGPHDVVHVAPGLHFIHQNNRGVAMGWGHDASPLIQSVLYVAIAAVVLGVAWQFVRMREASFTRRLPWALLLGGALGNLWDRVVHGAVLDFIDVFWNSWHYYTFNVADMAVSVAVVILLGQSFFEPKGQR